MVPTFKKPGHAKQNSAQPVGSQTFAGNNVRHVSTTLENDVVGSSSRPTAAEALADPCLRSVEIGNEEIEMPVGKKQMASKNDNDGHEDKGSIEL